MKILSSVVIAVAAFASNATAQITLRPEALAYTKAHLKESTVQPAFKALIDAAEKAASATPIAVTDKKTLLPPSNDPHDYFSLSPYWWPDPSKPDGLPYIRRDGVTNPESKKDLDQPRVSAMGDRVQTLALAYYFTGNEKYSLAAAKQIRTWFLDPATRMNPHLRFSQLVRGNPEERGSGIIDTRWFVETVDAISLIEASPLWTAADRQGIRDWFKAYLNWLLTTPNGAHERAAKNNHGSWYAAQTASYALFVGDTAKAREIAEGVKARIAWQIMQDGSQPEELARTRSYHYSNFNLEALGRVAEIGRKVGVDVWGYKADNGVSMITGLDRIADYAGKEKDWPGQQISDVDRANQLSTFRRARMATGNAAYSDAVSRLPSADVRTDRSLLLFPPQISSVVKSSGVPAVQHPGIFITKSEAAEIKNALGKYPLLDKSYNKNKAMVDSALAKPTDVPPPGEAGGYAHEKHKQNYREMQAAGLLYAINGEAKYAAFVRDMLLKYSVLYPTLGAHPLSKNQAPGKLFHQSLNEANWLVATSVAYDCIYDFLTAEQRNTIEKNVLRNMADWMSVTQAKEFDRIHNHGTWATASVGMLGLVINDSSYVNRALYGTKGDRKGGFLRQLDLLFSPDGYYMEGPYYIRYALMPFYMFAEAVERARPEVGVYKYRDGILKKGLYSALQTAFPSGIFAPINDASRTMAITAPEVVLATDLAYKQYGANPNLLGAAAIQDEVILNRAGLLVAQSIANLPTRPLANWNSVEFTDGFDGKRGGLGILRNGSGKDGTMLLMKYGVHGEGHGHFDKLHFILFDNGREVVPDYGFSRWINIEPKFGGRYLPENDSYAMQTIAHNTVVVDESTQNGADFDKAEATSAQRYWFNASDANKQGMSARSTTHYPGVAMQRTMLLLRDSRLPYPVVVDLYRLTSANSHTYDYPIHFRGTLISSSAKYRADTTQLVPLGKNFGYEHIWRTASATTDSAVSLTWLDGNRYYTVTTSSSPASEVIFGRTGAHDPNFNLNVEPLMIVRRKAANHLFASVIEPHGYFNEAEERSQEARPRLKQVRVIADTDDGSIIEVSGDNGIKWTIMTTNNTTGDNTAHSISVGNKTYVWAGNFAIEGLK
ncbi:MAG TPA: alginate lyase family protein [Longimicrobiales bacterium]|nr:alginate lyase family protein [Longimicrobiales bacterium]